MELFFQHGLVIKKIFFDFQNQSVSGNVIQQIKKEELFHTWCETGFFIG